MTSFEARKILGVSDDISNEDLKKAFKVKAFELHPDRNANDSQAAEKFLKVQEAFAFLSSEEKKKENNEFIVDVLERLGEPDLAKAFKMCFGEENGAILQEACKIFSFSYKNKDSLIQNSENFIAGGKALLKGVGKLWKK